MTRLDHENGDCWPPRCPWCAVDTAAEDLAAAGRLDLAHAEAIATQAVEDFDLEQGGTR